MSGNREISAINGASQWFNSEPLTAASIEGKVVLVSFWTYSCVNWRRTQPYLRAWADKYENDGLVVIGVHTPEFGFEKSLDNIRWAIKAMGVNYPVVVDNNFTLWRAFSNRYWPALYFIDIEDRIRHQKFGEDDYQQSERFIQKLLTEAGADVGDDLVSVTPQGLEVAADRENLQSPETYVGVARASGFASPGNLREGARVYAAAQPLGLNQWALTGNWTVGREAASVNEPGGRIIFRFHARDLNIVMGPVRSGAPVRFRILVDGQVPGDSHGVDVDRNGIGTVSEQRLYQLVRQPSPTVDREFEIEFLDAGFEVFSFTFG